MRPCWLGKARHASGSGANGRGRAGPAGLLATSLVAGVIGIAGVIAAGPASAQAGNTFYVDTNGGGTACTQTNPCSTVDQAVADADNASGASTIVVGPGTFSPASTLSPTVPLTIQGVPGQTTLDFSTAGASDGIDASQGLTLTGLTLQGAQNYAVYVIGGTADLEQVTLQASAIGLAVQNGAAATVHQSTVQDSGQSGILADGNVTVNQSTVSGNGANGLDVYGTASVVNSTLTANGGAGVAIETYATASVSDSTLSDNNTGLNDSNGAGTTLFGNIIADNTSADCAQSNNFTDNGYNLDSDGSCGFYVQGDQSGVNPQLGPLQDNGGPTETQAITPVSPAYHAVVLPCPATDQRGVSRPQPAGSSFCDTGAFEYSAPAALQITSPAVSGVASTTANLGPVTVEEVDADGNPVDATSLTSVQLSSSPSGAIFAQTQGGAPTTSVTINPGSSTTSFYVGDTTSGPLQVTAASAGLTSATQTEIVTPDAANTTVTAGASSAIQSAVVGRSFGLPLTASVTDQFGNAEPGVPVTFTAPSSGPSAVFANGSATITETTNSAGVATAPLKADTVASPPGQPYTVTATVGANSAQYTLTNLAGAPSVISAVPGSSPQSATVGSTFGQPLGVLITDRYGNPVQGVKVDFTAPTTGASATFADTATNTDTATTDSTGTATAGSLTANNISGSYMVVASTPGLGLPSVSFSLTNTVGTANSLTAGPNTTPQAVTVTKAFGTNLSVTATDAQGNPITNLPVTFTAPTSATGVATGTFSNGMNTITVNTNGQGVADAGAFTADTTAGSYAVTATAAGLDPVTFDLTNAPAAPAALVTNPLTTPQSTTVATDFPQPLGVTVTDAYGNAVPGESVTYTAPLSGPSGTFATSSPNDVEVTNSNGVAAPVFTANEQAGSPYSVTASLPSLPPVTFTLTNTPGVPTAVVPVGTSVRSANVGAAVSPPLTVAVTDKYGNAVPGASVVFTAPSRLASGTFGNGTATTTVVTNASGDASPVSFTANEDGGKYTVTAKVSTGPGTAPPTTTFSVTNHGLVLSPDPVTFPNVKVGGSALITVNVSNNTTHAINVSALTITGPAAADFTTTSPGCHTLGPGTTAPVTTLAPGATCRFQIVFRPGAKGQHTATVAFRSVPTQAIRLTGTGV